MTEVRNKGLPLWEKQGFKINLFSAITPDTMHGIIPQLNFNLKYLKNKHIPIPFSEPEKALFYSHYCLWEKSIRENKPLMILEEDAIPIKRIPKVWNVQRISILGKAISNGYIVTPIKSNALWEDAQKRNIKAQVDSFLYSHTYLKNDKKEYIIPSDDPGQFYVKSQKRDWSSLDHIKL